MSDHHVPLEPRLWVTSCRFQDVQGALGHAFLVPDPLARSVGGALLGTSNPEVVL